MDETEEKELMGFIIAVMNTRRQSQMDIVTTYIEEKKQQAKKEVFDKFKKVVEEHRKKSMITCPEDCFCWEVDAELLKEELAKENE